MEAASVERERERKGSMIERRGCTNHLIKEKRREEEKSKETEGRGREQGESRATTPTKFTDPISKFRIWH